MDTRLMKKQDRKMWEVIGFRSEQVMSVFGALTYRRRLYKNKKQQIQHNLVRRMKQVSARWTVEGGDRMSRVLA